MTSMDIFTAMKEVIPRSRAYELLQEWDLTTHAHLRHYIEDHYPELFMACAAYARIMGMRIR
jgi:thiamine phosphate synthase YjbQ (UPF0047 family)